jgi:hypothetical protein
MIRATSRKKTIAAFAVVALIASIAVSMIAYPVLATANTAAQQRTVELKAKGEAFQRVDSDTIKRYNVTLGLTLELGERKQRAIVIANASGSVGANGIVYTIESGKGLIGTKSHVAIFRCKGVDANGNDITLGIQAACFWWGGKLYALRGGGLLRTSENPMLLWLRGVAEIH